MLAHVRGQDELDHVLPESPEILLRQIREDVVLTPPHQLYALSRMMLLQHALIVVSYSKIGKTIDFEEVRFASVVHIMAKSSHYQTESRELINKCRLQRDEMSALHDLDPVIVVVEWVALLIVLGFQGDQETGQLIEWDLVVVDEPILVQYSPNNSLLLDFVIDLMGVNDTQLIHPEC
jgi:hypothetical protein